MGRGVEGPEMVQRGMGLGAEERGGMGDFFESLRYSIPEKGPEVE